MAKKTFKVKADKENISGYDSELEIEVDDNYEAYFKGNIPEPSQYTDASGTTITVTWFNNFGVRDKNSKNDTDVEYSVKLKKLPAGKRLFVKAKDGTIIEVMSKNPDDPDDRLKYSDAGGGNIKFSWNVGDPPSGMGP